MVNLFYIFLKQTYVTNSVIAIKPDKKYNIIFLETNTKRNSFSERQMCAIESAALNNPAANILAYSVKAKLENKLLNMYSNIKQLKLEFNESIRNTPFEEWFTSNGQLLLNGTSRIEHSSDILRIVSLWKLGGYYSDLDTITLKSIQDLIVYNGFALQSDSPLEVTNANIIFSRNHPLLIDLMQLMIKNYNPDVWTGIGSIKIKELIRNKCGKNAKMEHLVVSMKKLANSSNTTSTKHCGLSLFSQKYFSPYNWQQVNLLFQRNESLIISRFIDAYSIHFFSKISGGITSFINSDSVYEFFAKTNCPVTYRYFFKS